MKTRIVSGIGVATLLITLIVQITEPINLPKIDFVLLYILCICTLIGCAFYKIVDLVIRD